MLIEFKLSNYRSVREQQALSMIASNYSDELPQNLIPCELSGMKGTRLVKAVALYGANASGKSNVVAGLRFFADFVRDSATKLKPDAPTGVQPFKLDPACLDEPSKFEITAVIKGVRILYGLELTRDRVTSEYLVAYPKGKPQVWFERDWRGEAEEGKYVWSSPTENFKHDAALRDSVRANASFIASAAQLNHDEATAIWTWFVVHFDFLNLAEVAPSSDLALHFLRDSHSRKQFTELLKTADIGVQEAVLRLEIGSLLQRCEARGVEWGKTDTETIRRILAEVRDEPIREDESVVPFLVHMGKNGHQEMLDFASEESSGTKRLFALLGYSFHKLGSKGTLVIDEIESSLHPLLVQAFLRSFLAAEQPIGAQLVFTTHNPFLLDQDLLRRDQIWFTEKDDEGATRLYPLTEYKPRNNESLVKGYLAGRYGGIPFIPEAFKLSDPLKDQEVEAKTTEVLPLPKRGSEIRSAAETAS